MAAFARKWVVLWVTGVCIWGAAACLSASPTANPARRRDSATEARLRRAPRPSVRSRYTRPALRYRSLDPSLTPDRAVQIQKALIKAGYLVGPPSGVWDAATADAMRRYQAANGFDMTGLPEAKPLMKLGLGPHPLPRDVPAATPPDVDPNPPADIPNSSEANPPTLNPAHR